MKKIVLLAALLFPFFTSAEDNASKSVEKLAKEFANPNTPLTQLKFKIQHIEFAGDLNGATKQMKWVLIRLVD